jgi:hypothetical protein
MKETTSLNFGLTKKKTEIQSILKKDWSKIGGIFIFFGGLSIHFGGD